MARSVSVVVMVLSGVVLAAQQPIVGLGGQPVSDLNVSYLLLLEEKAKIVRLELQEAKIRVQEAEDATRNAFEIFEEASAMVMQSRPRDDKVVTKADIGADFISPRDAAEAAREAEANLLKAHQDYERAIYQVVEVDMALGDELLDLLVGFVSDPEVQRVACYLLPDKLTIELKSMVHIEYDLFERCKPFVDP